LVLLSPGVFGPGPAEREMRIEESVDGVERADFRIGFAAGTLEVRRLRDSDALIEGELELVTDRQPVWDVSQSGDDARLTLEYATGNFRSWSGRGDHWDLALSPRVAFTLNADMGAGDATLDLTGLQIRGLEIETGAGRSTIILPAEGRFDARITGGVGQMVIEIPAEMAARIEVDRGLGGLEIPGRFERLGGDVYESENWESSDQRVTIQVEVGVGQVSVRDR
jgi:hypothetical protein